MAGLTTAVSQAKMPFLAAPSPPSQAPVREGASLSVSRPLEGSGDLTGTPKGERPSPGVSHAGRRDDLRHGRHHLGAAVADIRHLEEIVRLGVKPAAGLAINAW